MAFTDRETLLVILGAGASYDCLPDEFDDHNTWVEAGNLPRELLRFIRPPLTQDLARPQPFFNRIVKRWPESAPVIDFLRRRLRGVTGLRSQAVTLEQALREYGSRQTSVPEVERHMLAVRFYLRDLLLESTEYMLSASLTGGITNYHALGNRLLDWCSSGNRGVCIVSFNYDLILEHALESLIGLDQFEIKSYLAHDRLVTLKPHGSAQWVWPAKSREGLSVDDWHRFGTKSLDAALRDGVHESSFDVQHYGSHNWRYSGVRRASVPAMALPVADKPGFAWPAEQSDFFRSLETRVTRVITIGWRALEPHFLPLLTPLVKVDSRIMIVTGGDKSVAGAEAVEIARELQPYVKVRSDAWRTYALGFRNFVDSEGLDWVLSG